MLLTALLFEMMVVHMVLNLVFFLKVDISTSRLKKLAFFVQASQLVTAGIGFYYFFSVCGKLLMYAQIISIVVSFVVLVRIVRFRKV